MFQQQQYDENLKENHFFQVIYTHHYDLLREASICSWIVAIPRNRSFQTDNITNELILDHILIPIETDSNNFRTLSKKQLELNENQLNYVHEQSTHSTRILFKETLYINKLKLILYCIEAPLFFTSTTNLNESPPLETLHNCIDFLWNRNLGICLGLIHELCADFEKKHTQSAPLEKSIENLFEACLKLMQQQTNETCDLNTRIAVEAYMQNCFNHFLVKSINTQTLSQDGQLNRILRRMAQMDVQMKSFDIPTTFAECIVKAKFELAKINNYLTALDKIHCIKTALNHLEANAQTLTSDLLLHILIFLICKIPINNWHANLTFLTKYQFAAPSECDLSAYLLTTLEAALTYLETLPNLDKFDVSDSFASLSVQDLKNSVNPTLQPLCHPLCSCQKCVPLTIDLDNVNDLGQTSLIIASKHGRLDLVEFLLNQQQNIVDLQDYSGKTALHYAAGRGHQSIVLVLLAWHADCNKVDMDGATPLHCATLAGWDSCVKALLYSEKSLDIDAVNKNGETALHFAAKWNYTEILRILLENHAKPTVKNAKNETAMDLVNNYVCQDIFNEHRRTFGSNDTETKETCLHKHVKPPNSPGKIDQLLRAIANDDLPLTCFYLGFSINNPFNRYQFHTKCHPLCICERCAEEENDKALTIPKPISVNNCNYEGLTPLHVAAKFGRTEIVQLLLDSQASPNCKAYKTLWTPLHFACYYRHLGVVKQLIELRGIEIDAQDCKGNTPLYWAVVREAWKVCEVLLKNGADRSFKDWDIL